VVRLAQRHWQWRAAIRIFEILHFSLLFLIIIIIKKTVALPESILNVRRDQSRKFLFHYLWQSIIPSRQIVP
jgi:hypothetical protein